MDGIKKKEYTVKYPDKENAYVFIPHDGIPFESAAVGITSPSADYEIKRRADNRICLFEYIVSGEGEVYVNGGWQKVSAGDYYILPAGTAHHYRSSHNSPWKKIWINYVADYMPSFLKAYGVKGGVYRAENVEGLFAEINEIANEANIGSDTAFRIAERIHRIVRYTSMKIKETVGYEEGMKGIIASYIYRKFSLEDMAERLHISRSNVIRLYKKRYGVTPYDDLLNMKIEAAKTLLRETKLPIKEIAYKLCIYDEHYFSSLFLGRTGERPGNFRKRFIL